MEETYLSLFDVAVFIFLAETIRTALQRRNIPSIIGELIAGIIIGPYALGGLLNGLLGFKLISLDSYVTFLAEFSVIMLIFASGLEHGIAPLRSAGILGAGSAVFGALLPFLTAFFLFSPRIGTVPSLFLGTAVGATSLAAVASLLEGNRNRAVDFIVSASAADDVVDLILLSVVLGVVNTRALGLGEVAYTSTELVVMWVVILLVSLAVIPRVMDRIGDNYLEEFPFLVLFGLVAFMSFLGYSPVIAAFVAGVSLANSSRSGKIREISQVFLSVFGSLFFVVAGAETDLLGSGRSGIPLALELTVVAMVMKVVGVVPFAYLYLRDMKGALVVSVGMTPRGETGLVVASIGNQLGVLDQAQFSSLVIMSLLTTVIGGLVFSWNSRYVLNRRD